VVSVDVCEIEDYFLMAMMMMMMMVARAVAGLKRRQVSGWRLD
jgi:hypothetical protein